MSKVLTYEINSIDGGFSPTFYHAAKGQYRAAIGIDPDLPYVLSSGVRTSGAIMPNPYTKFSGSSITGSPMWIVANPKTTNAFVYDTGGNLTSFDASIAMRTSDEASTAFPIAITGGAGNGAAYYNNFIYLAEATDISQYGGLDQGGSIAKTENVWTGAKFGKTALTNQTYPTMRGAAMPNHPMHVHGDNALYIGDVLPTGAASGASLRGTVHRLKTKRTTIDGDTDDASSYNALDLPYGMWPTDIESLGTDLVIAAIQTTDASVNQGNAALFLWDTFSDSYYRQVPLPDPLVTALYNLNGVIIVFTGNANNGFRVSAYTGGDSVTPLKFFEEGNPPFAGAVDALMTRLAFGSFTTFPENSASVFALGTKLPDLTQTVLHNIIRSTSGDNANQTITALKYFQQASGILPRMIVGWRDDSNKGLDKFSSVASQNAVFQTPTFSPGGKFNIKEIVIPFTNTMTSGFSITPKIKYDDEGFTTTLTTINNTNYPSAEKAIYKRPELAITGQKNFVLQLSFTGTVGIGVGFPIRIVAEVFSDESN
jgi:hypothetical protein